MLTVKKKTHLNGHIILETVNPSMCHSNQWSALLINALPDKFPIFVQACDWPIHIIVVREKNWEFRLSALVCKRKILKVLKVLMKQTQIIF